MLSKTRKRELRRKSQRQEELDAETNVSQAKLGQYQPTRTSVTGKVEETSQKLENRNSRGLSEAIMMLAQRLDQIVERTIANRGERFQ